MRVRTLAVAGAVTVLAFGATACGSSKKKSSGGGSTTATAGGNLTIYGEVLPPAKDGGRLRLRLTNRSLEPITLALQRTPVTLKVRAPLETLTVAADADRVLELAAGAGKVVEMNQTGKRRATRGRFTIGLYEGRPFLQGSVEVGSAKAE